MVDFEVWVGKGTERSTRFYGLGDDYKWIRIYLHNNTFIDQDRVSAAVVFA